jgi:hypothetical protein
MTGKKTMEKIRSIVSPPSLSRKVRQTRLIASFGEN